MKLAQALVERADLQKRLAQLRRRLLLNAKVQEGEMPAEDPKELLRELEGCVSELESLITRINLTNAGVLEGEEPLTALLARRDCLKIRGEALREFLYEASETVMRGTRSEVVVRSTVEVAALQKQVDALSKELRELDLRIQQINWTTELV